VPAGNYAEALLRVADQLCSGLSFDEPEEIPGAHSELVEDETLSAVDQLRVSQMRRALAKIAACLSGETRTPVLPAVRAALDGTEMVMRGALIRNNEDELPRLMPSMVFLVVLPVVGQNRAIELSERTAHLVTEELRRNDTL
jgi:hypothetical protein